MVRSGWWLLLRLMLGSCAMEWARDDVIVVVWFVWYGVGKGRCGYWCCSCVLRSWRGKTFSSVLGLSYGVG